MKTRSFHTLALAAALSLGVSGAAMAQQGAATAPDQDLDATTVQPDGSQASGVTTEGATDAPMAPMATTGTAGAASVEVCGAPMFADRTIAENAPNAPNLSTLVAGVQAAGLVETLAGPGPFTVFAPDNSAFEALPAGALDTLLQEGNRDQLTSVLTYHVVPGTLTAAELTNGSTLTTVEGGTLTVGVSGGTVTLTDEQGGSASVTQADVLQSNGVVHVIDTVLMPAM